jgi:Apc13p protein
MPEASDSNYAAATRLLRPMSTAGRPSVLEVVDDEWAADKLSDDEVDVGRHEAAVAPLLEEGELDADAIVSPAGNSSSAVTAAERRRREEGWTDLGLEHLDISGNGSTTTGRPNRNPGQS